MLSERELLNKAIAQKIKMRDQRDALADEVKKLRTPPTVPREVICTTCYLAAGFAIGIFVAAILVGIKGLM